MTDAAGTRAPTAGNLPANLHGCAILIADLGILIIGRARSGKSSLCISSLRRATSLGLFARLVADDRVIVSTTPDGPTLSAPERLYGLIEVSGVGIIEESAVAEAPLRLIVELCEPDMIERLPDEASPPFLGYRVRRIRLPERQSAFAADILVTLALGALGSPGRDEAEN